MVAQTFLTILAILLGLLVVRYWYLSSYQPQKAAKARAQLRGRLTHTSQIARVRLGSLVEPQRVASGTGNWQNEAVDLDLADDYAKALLPGDTGDTDSAGGFIDPETSREINRQADSTDIWVLRARLRDREETIRQLRQSLVQKNRELQRLRASVTHVEVPEASRSDGRSGRSPNAASSVSRDNASQSDLFAADIVGMPGQAFDVQGTAGRHSGTDQINQPGQRGPLFAASDEKDNLKKIVGIGPATEKALNQLGVRSFRQLAGMSTDDVHRLADALDTRVERIAREDWVGKAAELIADRESVS